MRHSFYFGNHQGIGERERSAVERYFAEFLDRYKSEMPVSLGTQDAVTH